MDDTTDQPEITTDSGYEAPCLIELGSIVELARGSGAADTADRKQWYDRDDLYRPGASGLRGRTH